METEDIGSLRLNIEVADASERDAVARSVRLFAATAGEHRQQNAVATDADARKEVDAMWVDRREFLFCNDLCDPGD